MKNNELPPMPTTIAPTDGQVHAVAGFRIVPAVTVDDQHIGLRIDFWCADHNQTSSFMIDVDDVIHGEFVPDVITAGQELIRLAASRN